MLLLNYEQVQYCQVKGNIGGESITASGLIYNGRVFVEAKSFGKDELEVAIKECREEYLDHEERSQIPTLLVKGKSNVGIWMQDERYKPHGIPKSEATPSDNKPQASSKGLERISVRQLASQMRSEGGINIKTRRQKLKLHHHCFLGNEAVDWMTEKLNTSREDAVRLGQKMIDKKIFHHILDEHPFKDEPLFYRFFEDETKNVWTDKII